jgi:hypothetical protein
VIALVAANPFSVPNGYAAAKYIDESRVPCPWYSVRSELDKILVPRRRACGDFEVGLDHHLAYDKTVIVMLLGPISPVHLSSRDLLDLRLGLENSTERPKIYIFIAPDVDTVHVIDDVATHQRSTL